MLKVFLEDNWHLVCLDENKDDKFGPGVPKDKRNGAWTGPLNSVRFYAKDDGL